jgi:hypothetical protein
MLTLNYVCLIMNVSYLYGPNMLVWNYVCTYQFIYFMVM